MILECGFKGIRLFSVDVSDIHSGKEPPDSRGENVAQLFVIVKGKAKRAGSLPPFRI
jgi:hypothetical protein